MHTLFQVIVGIMFGLFYSYMYSLSPSYILITILVGFILAILIIHKIDKKLIEPIPNWVDPNMHSIINKKKDVPYYLKLIHCYANVYNHSIIYISWDNLEFYLDQVVEKIKNTGIQYDAVIGIKTGGAIISDYVSKKLNIENYKIKITKSEYNCNKKHSYTIDNFIKKRLNINNTYDICEKINDNLIGKNVIVLDEQFNSGITMYTAINYLKEKQVNNIYPIVISNSSMNNQLFTKSYYIIKETILVWPWGYDN